MEEMLECVDDSLELLVLGLADWPLGVSMSISIALLRCAWGFEVKLISKGNCVLASSLLGATILDGGKRERGDDTLVTSSPTLILFWLCIIICYWFNYTYSLFHTSTTQWLSNTEVNHPPSFSCTIILYGSACKRPREYIFFYNVKYVFKQSSQFTNYVFQKQHRDGHFFRNCSWQLWWGERKIPLN